MYILEPKHGQGGLLVQKLCNISGRGGAGVAFQREADALTHRPAAKGWWQGKWLPSHLPRHLRPVPESPTHRGYRYGKQGVGQLATRSDDLVAVPTDFALWCATTGCGVSVEDHLQATDPLLASLYRFDVYYTTRRLLVELKVALPGNKSYFWFENAYDARAYKRLCTEFGVAPNTDWRQKLDHGCQGLGSWSTFMTPSGEYRYAHYSEGPFFHPKDAIRHNRDISGAWTTFIPDKSEGFTKGGVERLNVSIRTYVWAILGAQAQTRSNILMAGAGFDAQKQFLANVKDAIASPVDIPSSIPRYQKTFQYASTPLGYVFGIGLYLASSTRAMSRATTTKSWSLDLKQLSVTTRESMSRSR